MIIRRALPWCATGLAVFLALAAVVYFPWLSQRVLPANAKWETLSDVGQAYGGISAILSAAALCGIALSLVLQYRQHRAGILYSLNQRHFDLVRHTLENPRLAQSWGEDGGKEAYELRVFCNLIMTHWRTLWHVGELDEVTLERLAAHFFESEVSRIYWRDVGQGWVHNPSKPDRRFIEIISEQLGRATASGPAVVPLQPFATDHPSLHPRLAKQQLAALVAGAVGIGALAILARSLGVTSGDRRH